MRTSHGIVGARLVVGVFALGAGGAVCTVLALLAVLAVELNRAAATPLPPKPISRDACQLEAVSYLRDSRVVVFEGGPSDFFVLEGRGLRGAWVPADLESVPTTGVPTYRLAEFGSWWLIRTVTAGRVQTFGFDRERVHTGANPIELGAAADGWAEIRWSPERTMLPAKIQPQTFLDDDPPHGRNEP